jgi:hypothetical protein
MNERITASRDRALATLHRTQDAIKRVIEGNERLREFPGHEASAEARIAEGEQELAQTDAEIAALEAAEPPIGIDRH